MDLGQESDSREKRILLFAEDPVLFGLIGEYLRKVHPAFTIVNDSVEGMHLQHLPLMAAARHADVVIWDLNQICFLSAEVNWALRYLAASVPVILITPFGADDTSRRAKALGVAAYLSKPFKLGDLGRDLCRILGQDGKRSPRARTG